MKKIVNKINNVFIKVVLIIFYFLIIGLAALIYRLLKKEKKQTESYWQDFPQEKPDINYFRSPY